MIYFSVTGLLCLPFPHVFRRLCFVQSLFSGFSIREAWPMFQWPSTDNNIYTHAKYLWMWRFQNGEKYKAGSAKQVPSRCQSWFKNWDDVRRSWVLEKRIWSLFRGTVAFGWKVMHIRCIWMDNHFSSSFIKRRLQPSAVQRTLERRRKTRELEDVLWVGLLRTRRDIDSKGKTLKQWSHSCILLYHLRKSPGS